MMSVVMVAVILLLSLHFLVSLHQFIEQGLVI